MPPRAPLDSIDSQLDSALFAQGAAKAPPAPKRPDRPSSVIVGIAGLDQDMAAKLEGVIDVDLSARMACNAGASFLKQNAKALGVKHSNVFEVEALTMEDVTAGKGTLAEGVYLGANDRYAAVLTPPEKGQHRPVILLVPREAIAAELPELGSFVSMTKERSNSWLNVITHGAEKIAELVTGLATLFKADRERGGHSAERG